MCLRTLSRGVSAPALSYFHFSPAARRDPYNYGHFVTQVEFIYRYAAKKFTTPWERIAAINAMRAPVVAPVAPTPADTPDQEGVSKTTHDNVKIVSTTPQRRINPLIAARRAQAAPIVRTDLCRRTDKNGELIPLAKKIKLIPAHEAYTPPTFTTDDGEIVEIANKNTAPLADEIHRYEQRLDKNGALQWFEKETGKLFKSTRNVASVTRDSGLNERQQGIRQYLYGDSEDDKKPNVSLGKCEGELFTALDGLWDIDVNDMGVSREAQKIISAKTFSCKNPDCETDARAMEGKPYCAECHSILITPVKNPRTYINRLIVSAQKSAAVTQTIRAKNLQKLKDVGAQWQQRSMDHYKIAAE